MCTVCHKSFTEKRYRTRHYREKHQPGSNCWYHPDCDHKWFRSRSYKYREHLKDEHGLENDDIDEILGGTSRRRRRRDKVESDLRPQVSPPPIKHDRQNLAELQQILPLLTLGKDAHHASPPLIQSNAYNPRLGDADLEPEIATTKHEDSSGFEYLYTPPRLLSQEEFALLAGYSKFSIQKYGRIRFVHAFFVCDKYSMMNSTLRFPSVHPGRSTTSEVPSSPGMLHWNMPSPISGHHTSPAYKSPTVPTQELVLSMPRRIVNVDVALASVRDGEGICPNLVHNRGIDRVYGTRQLNHTIPEPYQTDSF